MKKTLITILCALSAQVAVYNWTTANFLALDVSALGWGTNTSVLVRNAQDYFTDTVTTTTTVSNTVVVNMQASAHTTAIPYGDSTNTVPTSFPAFGAFILQRIQ
jgi:hypothetical protein